MIKSKSQTEQRSHGIPFFENLPELMRPENLASILGMSTKTIYDWRYRQRERKVPKDLFVKFNRSLFIRTDVLRKWIASQNHVFTDG